jgi:hypothetical protein
MLPEAASWPAHVRASDLEKLSSPAFSLCEPLCAAGQTSRDLSSISRDLDRPQYTCRRLSLQDEQGGHKASLPRHHFFSLTTRAFWTKTSCPDPENHDLHTTYRELLFEKPLPKHQERLCLKRCIMSRLLLFLPYFLLSLLYICIRKF